MTDLNELIERVAGLTGPDREVDAEIVAMLNDAMVKRYPPSNDFGPKDRWQFWSLDGKHFLGNESKYPVPHYTSSVEVAMTLVRDAHAWQLQYGGDKFYALMANGQGSSSTPALALCLAALRARLAKGK